MLTGAIDFELDLLEFYCDNERKAILTGSIYIYNLPVRCIIQVNELKSSCGSATSQLHRSRDDVSDDLEAEFMGSASGRSHAVNRHKEQLRKIEREKKEQQEVWRHAIIVFGHSSVIIVLRYHEFGIFIVF